MSQVKLRDYQRDALKAIREARSAGINRQAVVMATGTGKSVVFSHIPIEVDVTGQHFLLVHRLELVEQAAAHFARANPQAKIGIEMASRYADPSTDDIVVASVQSIGSTKEEFNKRIVRFNRDKIGVVMQDELHHFCSPQNKNILKYLRVLKGDEGEDKSRLSVGLTATPGRSDGVGLENIVDKIVFERGIREMIDAGWLAQIQAHRIETYVDLSGIKTVRGDFATGELERRVNTPERNKIICDKYLEISPELRPAIAFSVDIRHSHDISLEFRKLGINSLPVSGDTPKEERARIIKSFMAGEVKVMVSCGIFSEGFDVPGAEIGLMCRPTKSSLLFAQQVGRLCRPNPSPEEVALGAAMIKKFATIIDFVDNSSKHQLCTIPTLFGLSSKFNAEGASITAALSEVEEAQEKFKQLDLDAIHDLRNLKTVMQSIDLLKTPVIPDELRGLSSMAWVMGPTGYQLIGSSFHFSVRVNQLGQYELARHAAGMRQVAATYRDLKSAVGAADGLVPATERNLVNATAKWRAGEPTPKQIKLLSGLDKTLYQKFGKDPVRFAAFVKSRFSKGDVSTLISEKMRGRSAWVKTSK